MKSRVMLPVKYKKTALRKKPAVININLNKYLRFKRFIVSILVQLLLGQVRCGTQSK
jgi:hypothetical protein